MKNLFDYIEEARQYVKFPLDKETFEELVLACFDCDDELAIKIMKEANIPEGLHWALMGWIDGHYHGEHPEESIDEMYDKLQRIPVNRLPKILGAGSEGSVIKISDKAVIKWFHKYNFVSSMDDVLGFYRYIQEHPHPNFPKVYKVTDRYVVLELLENNDEICKPYDLRYDAMQSIHMYVKHKQKIQEKIDPKILKWHIASCSHIIKFDGNLYPGDLRLKNLAVRPKTKEVVWFDP